MRANRDDTPFVTERPRNYTPVVVAAAVLVLAIPLYFVFREDPAPEPSATAALPVVRDNAVVAPPVVDTQAQQQSSAAQAPSNFAERRLAPEVPTVGAGTAEVAELESGDSLVIDGELLEEIEEDAQTADQ